LAFLKRVVDAIENNAAKKAAKEARRAAGGGAEEEEEEEEEPAKAAAAVDPFAVLDINREFSRSMGGWGDDDEHLYFGVASFDDAMAGAGGGGGGEEGEEDEEEMGEKKMDPRQGGAGSKREKEKAELLTMAEAPQAGTKLFNGPGYVFHCNKQTRGEVMEKSIFGCPKSGRFADIKPGAPCFLFNVSTQKFEGLFLAVSTLTRDIDPGAWEGRFPYQVRFRNGCDKAVSIDKKVARDVLGNDRDTYLTEAKQRKLTTILQVKYGMKALD
jgi:hypothetical protein